jgi:hypothetical protein
MKILLNIKQTLKIMMNTKEATDFWLLVTALNCAQFSLVQLKDNPHVKHRVKMQFNMFRNQLNNFKSYIHNNSEKEMVGLLQNLSYDNVAAMSETMAMIALVPQEELDWFLEQTQKLVWAAVNRYQTVEPQTTEQ